MKTHEQEWLGIHKRCQTTPCTVERYIYIRKKERRMNERQVNLTLLQ
jgi:hypothetical protein